MNKENREVLSRHNVVLGEMETEINRIFADEMQAYHTTRELLDRDELLNNLNENIHLLFEVFSSIRKAREAIKKIDAAKSR